MAELKPVEWKNNQLVILDQTLLPGREKYLKISAYPEVIAAIRRLAVRGAPAIGIAAAYGVALGALSIQAANLRSFKTQVNRVIKELGRSRPTARNLFFALERMQAVVQRAADIPTLRVDLIDEARTIHREQEVSDMYISQIGAKLFERGGTILTHCNAGGLATGGQGTALGVIKQAFAEGKDIRVMATETRPLLQGARLTAFELKKAGVPFKLITDSMVGTLMRQGRIQGVITGADRIARNGDTANKIGTYSLAVLAKEHGIPFYIAAPLSTVDLALENGLGIVIEQRSQDEVTSFQGIRVAPRGTIAINPAFDVTPHEYITAIVTERGIFRGEYEKSLTQHQIKR